MGEMTINVDADEFFAAHRGPAILGPSNREARAGAGWVVYLPGETPCICDDYESAHHVMSEWLSLRGMRARAKRARGGK